MRNKPEYLLELSRFWTKKFLKEAGKISSVLDIGFCGDSGVKTKQFSKLIPDAHYTGLDMDFDSILNCKSNLKISCSKGDVFKMPFQDNTFDLVINSHLLEHLDNPYRAISEIKRVSRRHILTIVPVHWGRWWLKLFYKIRGYGFVPDYDGTRSGHISIITDNLLDQWADHQGLKELARAGMAPFPNEIDDILKIPGLFPLFLSIEKLIGNRILKKHGRNTILIWEI